MDFSSRWFITEQGGNEGSMKDLKTRSIIAVELNAILHWNAKIIAEFYGYAKNYEKQVEYEKKADEILVVKYNVFKLTPLFIFCFLLEFDLSSE